MITYNVHTFTANITALKFYIKWYHGKYVLLFLKIEEKKINKLHSFQWKSKYNCHCLYTPHFKRHGVLTLLADVDTNCKLEHVNF